MDVSGSIDGSVVFFVEGINGEKVEFVTSGGGGGGTGLSDVNGRGR